MKTLVNHTFLDNKIYSYIMILGSKGHVFHACMKKHEFDRGKAPTNGKVITDPKERKGNYV